ncbi:MAG TPA: hypothetical protein VL418_04450 [Devosiaceae bacterium]|nr:hypothetical protein [Devosiaceae bacterium]
MSVSMIRMLSIVAMLIPAAPALAASGPIAASRLVAHCQSQAISNFGRQASGINVMGATEALDNTWVAVGTAAVGSGQKDFMCNYDTQRRFTGLTRID